MTAFVLHREVMEAQADEVVHPMLQEKISGIAKSWT